MKNLQLAAWQNSRHEKYQEHAQKERELRLMDVALRSAAMAEDTEAYYQEENRWLLDAIAVILITAVLLVSLSSGLVICLV